MKRDANTAFKGLWLSDLRRVGDDLIRAAILFMEDDELNYIVRFNHDMDENFEGMTSEFVWDYSVSTTVIRQHPRGYPADIQIEIPWRRASDGSLMLEFEGEWLRFLPASMDQLSDARFEMDYIVEVIEEAKAVGLRYQLEPHLPLFPTGAKPT